MLPGVQVTAACMGWDLHSSHSSNSEDSNSLPAWPSLQVPNGIVCKVMKGFSITNYYVMTRYDDVIVRVITTHECTPIVFWFI